MSNVIIWSKYNCPYCDQAKALLKQRDVQFEERKIGDGFTKEQLLEAIPTARSVPQIIINDNVIGGFTELRKYIDETGFNGSGY
jgi:glutaredoxin